MDLLTRFWGVLHPISFIPQCVSRIFCKVSASSSPVTFKSGWRMGLPRAMCAPNAAWSSTSFNATMVGPGVDVGHVLSHRLSTQDCRHRPALGSSCLRLHSSNPVEGVSLPLPTVACLHLRHRTDGRAADPASASSITVDTDNDTAIHENNDDGFSRCVQAVRKSCRLPAGPIHLVSLG